VNNAIEMKNFPFRERHLSNPIRLITTGNLVAKKNHEFLVRVVDHLQKSGVDCELEILGFGMKEEAINLLISQLRLENKIRLRGSVSNVIDYLLEADLYLHAAQPEPFGIAILEAMATGLPVVTLDGGGNRDFVFNGLNGYILEEKNVDSFAERILNLKNDQQLYNTLSLEARKTALQFDMASYSSKILLLYEGALDSIRKKNPD
jgi:glycosyltransferase involved in cell wall biosynthesis